MKRRFFFPPCFHCFAGSVPVVVTDCEGVPGHTCDHLTHIDRRPCRWCRGSARSSIFYAVWRYIVG
jgi:hypothetical protein